MRFNEIDDVYYFGYGHNTNSDEFLKRIPDAKMLGVGVLKNFKFVLKKYANIQNREYSKCHGVVWKISIEDLKTLDHDEGLHQHYNRIPVEVELNDRKIEATTYIMDPAYHSDSLPSKKYINFIADGYKQAGIPLSQLKDAIHQRLKDNV